MGSEQSDRTFPIAMVSGASSGIGRATARRLVEGGFNVALVGRDRERLSQACVGLPPGRTLTIAQDLTEFEALDGLVARVEAQLGPIDLLVNNAGMAYTNSIEATSIADWQRVLSVNLTAPFALTRAVLSAMRQRRRGTILHMVSIAGARSFPQWGAYCASKAALLSFSRTLAQEVRSEGIRVTALCPGSVDTALWDSDLVEADFDRSAMMRAETVAGLVLYAATVPPDAVLEEAVLMPGLGAF